MIISKTELLKDIVDQQLKVSHLNKKIDFAVVEASKVNKTMKEKLGADVIKNSDIILGFVEKKINEQPKDDQQEDVENDQDTEDQNTEDTQDNEEKKGETTDNEKDAEKTDTENTEGDKEGTEETGGEKDQDEEGSKEDGAEEKDGAKGGEDEKDDEKKKKQSKPEEDELNESVKIQDLTSKMLSPIKVKKVKTCGKIKESEKTVKKPSKKPKAKPFAIPLGPKDSGGFDQGTPYAGGGGDCGGAVEEAETEATGADLVEKVRKCVQKIFKTQETDTNKIEIKSVPDMGGVYYCALKFGTPGVDIKEEK